MSKATSIGILSVTAIAVLAALWFNFRTKETDIYLAALAPYSNSTTILISRPSTCLMATEADPGFKNLPPDLVNDFLAVNAPGAKPVSLNALKEEFSIADTSKLDSYTRAGVPREILIPEQRPLVSLSRVGFNHDRTEALFCLESREGFLLHLRLNNGHWQQVSFVSLWVS
jgi:hypothetical protein